MAPRDVSRLAFVVRLLWAAPLVALVGCIFDFNRTFTDARPPDARPSDADAGLDAASDARFELMSLPTTGTVWSAAFDNAGAIYLVGSYHSSVALAEHPLKATGRSDIFVVKLRMDGGVAWAQTFGGDDDYADSPSEWGRDIALDAAGNAYVTGRIYGVADEGGACEVGEAGAWNVFVARFASKDGACDWARSSTRVESGSAPENSSGHAVAVDSKNNAVYVAGALTGKLGFATGDVESKGSFDILLVRYKDGAEKWVRSAGNTSNDLARGVTVDNDGDAYITGTFNLQVDLGTHAIDSSGNSTDLFVARCSSAGTFQWAKQAGTTQSDSGAAIAWDGTGQRLWVVADWNGDSAGAKQLYLASYLRDGTPESTDNKTSAARIAAGDIAAIGPNHLLIAGSFDGETLSYPGGSLTVSGSGRHLFAASYTWSTVGSVNALHVSSGDVPGSNPWRHEGRGIAHDPVSDYAVVVGQLLNTITAPYDGTAQVTAHGYTAGSDKNSPVVWQHKFGAP